MENQISVGDKNTQQIGQNQINQPMQISEQPRFNYRIISTIFLFILLVLGALFYLSNKNKSSKEQTSVLFEENKQNNIPEGWKTYTGDGLSFSYESDWQVESPSKLVFGNEKTWQIERFISDDPTTPLINESNRSTFLRLSRVKNYDPLPGSDSLRSYLSESWGTGEKGKLAQDTTFNGRNAIRYTNPGERTSQASDTLVISIPEENELLLISFSDDWTSANTWTESSLTQSVKKYFDPFLQSLKITSTSWPQPGTYLSIVANKNFDTVGWKVAQTTNYSLSYPKTWTEKDKDIDGTKTLNFIKNGAQVIDGRLDVPQLFLGSPEIFSTSGALCGNAGPGECEEVGQVEIKVKERTYAAPIIKKRIWKTGQLSNSFYYVFQIYMIRIPTTPTVTAVFKDLSEGQEIVDFLSTISY